METYYIEKFLNKLYLIQTQKKVEDLVTAKSYCEFTITHYLSKGIIKAIKSSSFIFMILCLQLNQALGSFLGTHNSSRLIKCFQNIF